MSRLLFLVRTNLIAARDARSISCFKPLATITYSFTFDSYVAKEETPGSR